MKICLVLVLAIVAAAAAAPTEVDANIKLSKSVVFNLRECIIKMMTT